MNSSLSIVNKLNQERLFITHVKFKFAIRAKAVLTLPASKLVYLTKNNGMETLKR